MGQPRTRGTAARLADRGRGALAVAVVVAAGAAVILGGGACNNSDDPGPAVPVEPAVIYAQMCARCHGADGRGDAEIRKTMPVRDFHDPALQARAGTDEIARVIMGGKGQMPAFGASLSLPKIQSLSGYVRRLGRGQAAAP